MRRCICLLVTAGCLAATATGCRDQNRRSGQDRAAGAPSAEDSPRNTLSKPDGSRDLEHAAPGTDQPVDESAAEAKTDVSEERPEMPRVLLTQSHAELCRVQVGDVLPPVRLADLDGTEHDVSSLFGDELTIVFFWTGQLSSARTGLADLDPDVLTPYKDHGVRVVGIAVEEKPQEAKQYIDDADATFVNLVDPDGSAFAQVGTGMLPRIFLVDSRGKILWFDMEYSRSTRRDLRQAIRSVVGDP